MQGQQELAKVRNAYIPMYQPRRAVAFINGSRYAPNLRGYVLFTDQPYGTEVTVEVNGLPPYRPATNGEAPIGPHGFHIHEHGNCEGGFDEETFPKVGSHWNPTNQPHGNHAGDFPPLFSNNGYARMSFFTNKFKVDQVIGRAVIIHLHPDDFRTQPSGDSGPMIGCGEIRWE